MNFNQTLRNSIASAVNTPADPRISGAILQEQLLSVVNALDTGAKYMGMATPSTVPTTEANCFFLTSQEGTYANFTDTGGKAIVVNQGELAVIRSVIYQDNLRWQKATLFTGGGGSAQLAVSITYAALKALRDGGNLVPGTWYRITDYACTTTQENTQSANHAFDIIVRADDASHLNENGYAAHHAGDTYFATCKLEAWELKYSLDNDTNRFAWADEENGKGVIFYMKDEWNNECPYDFKNMMFLRGQDWREEHHDISQEIFGDCEEEYFYTFSCYDTENLQLGDASLKNCEGIIHDTEECSCFCNTIKIRRGQNGAGQDSGNLPAYLNNIVFFNTYETDMYYSCFSNVFETNCFDNTFGNSCYNNTFGNECYSNTFGNNFQYNTFGNNCFSNSFGNECYSNTFGNNCYNNSFGNKCNNNSFGNGFQRNTFGNYCYQNSFGNYCQNNSFGNKCNNNSFGNGCYSNTFGNECYNNSFGNSFNNNTFGNYCQTITVFDGVQNCSVTGGSQSAPVKNAQILNGTAGASEQNKLTIAFAANKAYTQVAAKTTAGNLQIFNPADLVQ